MWQISQCAPFIWDEGEKMHPPSPPLELHETVEKNMQQNFPSLEDDFKIGH